MSIATVGGAYADVKIGITVSASGPGASLGQPQMKTVGALPKEIAGEKITYIALDDESDPTKGAQNARKLVLDEKVDILIGSSLSPVSLPLVDIAAENKTPLLTLAAAAAIVAPMDEKRKWAFKVVPNDDLMAEAILKYIGKTGVKTIAYIGVSDAYGEGYYKVLADLAPKLGIKLLGKEVYARSDASVTGQVLKTISLKPEAVFIASAGTPAVLPQKALRERGYKGPIYQTHGIATDDFVKLGGKDVDGAIFAGEAYTIADDLEAGNPFKKITSEYIEAYKKSQNQSPVIFGAHLYDSMQLVANALPSALKAGKPGTPEFRSAIRDSLELTKNVYLNNGLSNMSPADHNGYDERSAFLIKLDQGKFRLLKD
ncbi:ABC transporter substrate-binding protein [Tardiphaga alba]|uniref:ABC transporter substrate-binding protein n=2 Tax=Tardiphaga alba TaxID=340268 RepID=A0ABX8AFU4_9BRAD|nr:ABC transporter substrate-binding protein [Tardiphaga alba]QUS42422.1 ABC transporter substrate-binding protein [Tardiphaga alba]